MQTGSETARPHVRSFVTLGFSGAQTHREFRTNTGCSDDLALGGPVASAKVRASLRSQLSTAVGPLSGSSLVCGFGMGESDASLTHGCERFARKPKPPPARLHALVS